MTNMGLDASSMEFSSALNFVNVPRPLALTAAIVLIGAVLYTASRGSATDGEPTRISYAIPFFGHAFKLAKDKRTFFRQTFENNFKRPYSIFVAGRWHYVFSDLVDVAAVHKFEKDLNIKGFKKFVYTHIFGFSSKDFDVMWEVSKEAHSIDTKWLTGQDQQQKMTAKYFACIEDHLQKLDTAVQSSPAGVLEIDGLNSVIDLEGSATIETMYGATTLKRHPSLLDDLTLIVTKGFKPLLFGAPRFMARKAYAARDRIIATYAELADELETRTDASDYFHERFGYINAWGVDRNAVGSDMFRNMFASLLNSLPTTYLGMLHILQSKDLTRRVREELTAAGYEHSSPEERVSILPSKVPLLRSIWFETLRMHNNLLTVREVTKDLTLPGTRNWHLKKGNVISVPAGLVHFDENLHSRPDEFHAGRFLDKSEGGEGENATRTLKPFGGGSTYCPGRIFGEKQLMGFIAGMIMRYNIEVSEEVWTIPPVSDFDDLWLRPRVHWKLSKRHA